MQARLSRQIEEGKRGASISLVMTVEDTVGNLVGIALVIADREIENSGNDFLNRVKLFDDHIIIRSFSGIHLDPVVEAIGYEEVCSVIFLFTLNLFIN